MFLYRFVWTVLSGVRERDKDGPQVVNNKTFRRQLFPPSAMLDLIGGSGFLLKFLLSSWTAERFMYQDYYTLKNKYNGIWFSSCSTSILYVGAKG